MAKNLGQKGHSFKDEARKMGDVDILDDEMLDGNEDGSYKPVEPKILPNYDGSLVDVPQAKDMRKHSWMATINNPEKIFPGKTPDEIVNLIGQRFSGKTRCCMVNYERGLKEHTDHCHVLVESNNREAIRASTLEKLFPAKDENGKNLKKEVEVYDGNKKGEDGKRLTKKVEKQLYWLFWHEPTTSDYATVLAYFSKVGSAKNKAKNETLIVSPKEFGTGVLIGHIGSGRGKKQDFDLNEAYEFFKRGLKPRDIYDMDQNWRYQSVELEKMYNAYVQDHGDSLWDMEVVWCYGASGTGKSISLVDVEAQLGRREVYVVNSYQNPFDSYEGQECVFLDEFRGSGSGIKLATILSWTIGLRGEIDARYANRVKNWKHVYVTSIYMPEKCYEKETDQEENIAQLKRRITKYIYFFRTEDGGYHQMEFKSTLGLTKAGMQDAILAEFPTAIFDPFTADTWEDHLAEGGKLAIEQSAERQRDANRKRRQAPMTDLLEKMSTLVEVTSRKASAPIDVEPSVASPVPSPAELPAVQPLSPSADQATAPQYLYTPDMKDSLEQSLAELEELFVDDEDDEEVQELLDAMGAASSASSPAHGDERGGTLGDNTPDDDDPDGPDDPGGGSPAPSDDEYVSDFFAAGGFYEDFAYDPEEDDRYSVDPFYDDPYADDGPVAPVPSPATPADQPAAPQSDRQNASSAQSSDRTVVQSGTLPENLSAGHTAEHLAIQSDDRLAGHSDVLPVEHSGDHPARRSVEEPSPMSRPAATPAAKSPTPSTSEQDPASSAALPLSTSDMRSSAHEATAPASPPAPPRPPITPSPPDSAPADSPVSASSQSDDADAGVAPAEPAVRKSIMGIPLDDPVRPVPKSNGKSRDERMIELLNELYGDLGAADGKPSPTGKGVSNE